MAHMDPTADSPAAPNSTAAIAMESTLQDATVAEAQPLVPSAPQLDKCPSYQPPPSYEEAVDMDWQLHE